MHGEALQIRNGLKRVQRGLKLCEKHKRSPQCQKYRIGSTKDASPSGISERLRPFDRMRRRAGGSGFERSVSVMGGRICV